MSQQHVGIAVEEESLVFPDQSGGIVDFADQKVPIIFVLQT